MYNNYIMARIIRSIIKFLKENMLMIGMITIFLTFLIGGLLIRKRENYSGLTNQNGNVANKFENLTGLYKSEVGVVGTRKDFSNMRKPLLNPQLVPIIKNITE